MQQSVAKPARAVCFVDDCRLAAGCIDGRILCFDLQTEQTVVETVAHQGEVNSLAISSSGRFLLSAADDCKCRVWCTWSFDLLEDVKAHDLIVYSATWAKDETKFISCSYDWMVKVHSFPDSCLLFVLAGHTNVVMSCACNDSFTRAISGSWDHSVNVWDLVERKCELRIDKHGKEVNAVAIDASGKYGVTAGEYGYTAVDGVSPDN